MKDYVQINNKFYMVSTVDTFDVGLETMVFECDEKGKVSNWEQLYFRHYKKTFEATMGHIEIVGNLKKYLNEERKDWGEVTGKSEIETLGDIMNLITKK